ncbi:MAG TPA: YsnF/AvaK domain-containing protein [Steroidobacter sp.]|uniref:YsnF/AvaK domain-containing protein n=1 Tax=Steroidobacter sp. TaxID=1978227 RepID=UPI002ED8E886
MTTRTITAIYDSESEAQAARAQLLDHGLDDGDVRIVSQQLTSTRVGTDAGEDRGIWESIKDFFVGDDDRPMYSEGLRRGGCLLTARVTDERSDEAIAVLEGTNAVDLDQRTEQWRAEGWSGSSGDYLEDDARLSTGEVGARDERSIPIVEERLRVGKREVDRGGVRVRSYIVEEPVREDVSLREERVEIERRPGQAAASPEMFRDQTIEVSERGEEAMVAKDAVVKEEVVVRKTADDRTETVEDTVRHTEVDVEDTRDTTTTRDPAGTKGTKPRTRRPT